MFPKSFPRAVRIAVTALFVLVGDTGIEPVTSTVSTPIPAVSGGRLMLAGGSD